MPSHSKIRIASTKWFDIIYPVESENSARELFDKADSIYEKICASYGKEPDFRMPVVITPDTDAYNAYFSNGHYNHIVLLMLFLMKVWLFFLSHFLELLRMN